MTITVPENPVQQVILRLALTLTPGTIFMLAFATRSFRADSHWQFTLFDDALISFAYGRTLADTGEWVWFPGADRVQGITNPLWSAVMAVIHLPDPSPPVAIVLMTAVSMVVLLATGVTLYFAVSAAGLKQRSALIVAGSVPFLYPLTFWTLRGMEVGLLALLSSVLVLAAVHLQSPRTTRQLRWFAVATAAGSAAVATRLDALAIVGVVVILAMLRAGPAQRARWAVVLATVIAATGLILLFQGVYWGDWLPNTYRLKVEGVPFTDRLVRGFFATGTALPLLVLGLLIWRLPRGENTDRYNVAGRFFVTVTAAVVAVALGYSVWSGGDAWEWSLILNRTLSVALPLGLAGWLVATRGGTSLPERRWVVVLAVSGAGLGLTTNPHGFDFRLAAIGIGLTSMASLLLLCCGRFPWRAWWPPLATSLAFVVATSAPGAILWVVNGSLNVAEDQRFASRSAEITRVTDPDATVAVMWAGAPGYFSQRSVIDMFGKSDRTIANQTPRVDPRTGKTWPFIPGHNKWDYEHSIKNLGPDLVFQLGDDRDLVEQQILDWGYERRCLSDGWVVYPRSDSTAVRWNDLSDC